MRTLQRNLCKLLLTLTAVAGAVSIQQLAHAQSATRSAPGAVQRDPLILLTYEVGDLVLSVPDYPYSNVTGASGSTRLWRHGRRRYGWRHGRFLQCPG